MESEGAEGVRNVHEHLEQEPCRDTERIALVKGTYKYCHFGQQGVNDSVSPTSPLAHTLPRTQHNAHMFTHKGVGLRIQVHADAGQLVPIERGSAQLHRVERPRYTDPDTRRYTEHTGAHRG